MITYDIAWQYEGPLQAIDSQPKLAQLDKVLCQWFTAIHSEEKPVTGPVIIEKANSFYDQIKITEKCMFS